MSSAVRSTTAMVLAVSTLLGLGCRDDPGVRAQRLLFDLESGKRVARMQDAVRLVRSPCPMYRVVATEIVRMTKDPAGVPMLVDLLTADDDVVVVSSAAAALREFDNSRLAEAAAARIDSMTVDRLYALCHALGAKSDRASMELLQQLAVHEDRGVRGRAYRSLATFADKSMAVSALTALLPGPTIRDTAVVLDVLVGMDPDRAEEAAHRLLSGGVPLSVKQREVAEWAIARLEAMRNGSPDPGSCEERFAPPPLPVGSFEL